MALQLHAVQFLSTNSQAVLCDKVLPCIRIALQFPPQWTNRSFEKNGRLLCASVLLHNPFQQACHVESSLSGIVFLSRSETHCSQIRQWSPAVDVLM